eukprot:SAG22_NODE_956_length_6320_cov_2.476933_2_plen_147_part_00
MCCASLPGVSCCVLLGRSYNFHPIGDWGGGNQRTADTFGRGGARQSTFVLEEYQTAATTLAGDNTPQDRQTLTPLGKLSKEEVYDRARYFLRRVLPHAEKWNVQLACHLEDPPAPELLGIEMWNYPVLEGCERFANLVDSPMHGFK